MESEYASLIKNETWVLTTLPPHRKVIGCKWVFKLKENPDGSIAKYKARLVAKGFHQSEGFEFHETFSPIVKPTTIHVILTLAITHRWNIQQIDINNVFLNGGVYMQQPPSFDKDNPQIFRKLNKTLYGLKQAPRVWY